MMSKIIGNKFKWFRHFKRREKLKVVKTIMEMSIERRREESKIDGWQVIMSSQGFQMAD